MEYIVITITRDLGTGGREIAARLTDRSGTHSYVNRILMLAPQYSGRDERDFVEMDERLRDGHLRQQLMSLQERSTPLPHVDPSESDDHLFEFQEKITQELARIESCVTVGKYADYVPQDFDSVLSVYVEARRILCVNRVMKTMNVSEDEAHSLIAKTDKYRAEYYKHHTGGSYWASSVNYDMVLNNGRWSIDQCVDLIVQALQVKFDGDCKKTSPFI